jgi:hypothetical protein
MIFICHRANIDGTNNAENSPDKIKFCISLGFDAEIDVWNINNNFYLGHDKPEYETNLSFLLDNSKNLWCHAKNLNALESMLRHKSINCFWHQNDDYTITSHGFIWTFPNKFLPELGVAVMPEQTSYSLKNLKKCYGICSDNVIYYKQIFETQT